MPSYAVQFQVKFARAEALHIHGYFKEACCLCIELANELMVNPPRLTVEVSHPTPQIHLTPTKHGHVGSKKKRRSQDVIMYVHPKAAEVTHLAATTLSRGVFLCQVLLQDCGTRHLAFRLALFVLELSRQPAATKLFEVKMHHLESLLVGIIRRIRWGPAEMNLFRERATRMKSPHLQLAAVMPWNLAILIFQALSGIIDGEQTDLAAVRQPGDEQLGFDAAVAALGWRFAVSEIEYPLLCEGLRRLRGELAMNLLIRYKDNHERMALTMDRLLDLQMHQMYRHYSSNASYYGTYPMHPGNHVYEHRGIIINNNSNNNVHPLGENNNPASCSLQRSVSGVSMNSCSNGDDSEDSFLNMEDIPLVKYFIMHFAAIAESIHFMERIFEQ